MVPVQAIAEALGLEVDYKDNMITITNPANGEEGGPARGSEGNPRCTCPGNPTRADGCSAAVRERKPGS
ncbi:hypothetical protein [Desulfovirgula thermocuniculi]|uniref:hypothetical protein n=1 Tax=Desulfovirgula thermocuniculi TaxID=348842 RepID=UPI000A077E8D